MQPFGLYLHIPFCFHKCPYCDFNTYAVTSVPEHDYIAALLAELDYRAAQPEWRGREVRTIFFGGGTPSLLSPAGITRLIHGAARLFPINDQAEISLEANPGTVTLESLQGYRSAGVNRISIGAQSFQPEHLKFLGRLHSGEQVEEAFQATRMAGFKNISIDLMHGLPNQTPAELQADIEKTIRLNPEHISAYGLTIEKGTPLYTSVARGKVRIPQEKRLVELMELLNKELPRRGYYRYEVSNFAKLGREARHNLAYWDSQEYLGIGAGAHSYLLPDHQSKLPRRWSNFALPIKYMKEATSTGQAEAWRDSLNLADAIFDYLFLGLRKIAGFSLTEFGERFGFDFRSLYENQLELHVEHKLLSLTHDRIALTEQGLMVADSVIEEFSAPNLKQARAFVSAGPIQTISTGRVGNE
jgi:oxygen-independent coproporphyrinogen-3 oxidase